MKRAVVFSLIFIPLQVLGQPKEEVMICIAEERNSEQQLSIPHDTKMSCSEEGIKYVTTADQELNDMISIKKADQELAMERKRIEDERERLIDEQKRLAEEQKRLAAERERLDNEQKKLAAEEKQRQEAEEQRKKIAEQERAVAEQNRLARIARIQQIDAEWEQIHTDLCARLSSCDNAQFRYQHGVYCDEFWHFINSKSLQGLEAGQGSWKAFSFPLCENIIDFLNSIDARVLNTARKKGAVILNV